MQQPTILPRSSCTGLAGHAVIFCTALDERAAQEFVAALLKCNMYQPGSKEQWRFSTVFTPSTMACNTNALRMLRARSGGVQGGGRMALCTVCAMKAAPTTCSVNALPAKSERNLSPCLFFAKSSSAGQRFSHRPCNLIRSTPRTTRWRRNEYGAEDGRGQVSMSTAESVKVLATSMMASHVLKTG